MSDDDKALDGTTPPPSADAAAPRAPKPSPSARARRIGGSSRTGPAPSAGPSPRPQPAVDLGKDEVVTGSPTVPGEETEPRRPVEIPTWLRWLPAGALGVAAVIMAVFFLTVSHGVWWGGNHASTAVAREKVLAAAKQCTVAANTYSYTTFAQDEAKGAACTTGQQTANYQQAMQNVIRARAVQLKASQSVQINTAGISSVTPDGSQWTVLVFGQLTIHTSQLSSKGRVDPFAAVVRMDDVHGKWLMSSIDPVATASS